MTRQSIIFHESVLRMEMDTRVKPAYDDWPVNASLILFAKIAASAAAFSRGFAAGVVISASPRNRVWRDA
jgi:hypothetical protein